MNILITLKEFLTGYCLDGKIYNCRENSFVWYHEKGHIEHYKNKKFFAFLATVFTYTPFIMIMVYDSKFLFYLVVMIYVLTMLYSEMWAWTYAITYYGKNTTEKEEVII